MRDVKAGSSKFINEKRWLMGRFSWQEGFGAFSHARSQLGAVIRYIQDQQKHHAKKSFRDGRTGSRITWGWARRVSACDGSGRHIGKEIRIWPPFECSRRTIRSATTGDSGACSGE